MEVSKRSEKVTPSLTRALFNKAKSYDNVIDLTLGDPDLDTPQAIKEASIEAINNNMTHYSANAGLLEVRQAVSRHIEKIWPVKSDPLTDVIVTVGGMEAIYLAMLSLVDDGDEVIIFAPYYVNYEQMIKMCGGKCIVMDCYNSDTGIDIDTEELKKHVTEKTKAIIVNSPNNPTGAVFPEETLHDIAKIARENDLMIISDEVYRTLTYDGRPHSSILKFDEAKERTILIDSMSKEFSMTGFRIGYAWGPKQFIAAMTKLQENVAACACVPCQWALLKAYDEDIDTSYMRIEFEKRRDYLCGRLSKMPHIKFYKPAGTFYLMADISAFNMGSEEFAYDLLDKARIAVVPGKAYGKSYDGFVRIAFTKEIDVLGEAMDRLEVYLNDERNFS